MRCPICHSDRIRVYQGFPYCLSCWWDSWDVDTSGMFDVASYDDYFTHLLEPTP